MTDSLQSNRRPTGWLTSALGRWQVSRRGARHAPGPARRPSFAIAAALVVTASLAACSSTPPLRFHTLVAPAVPAPQPTAPAPFVIEVLPVGVPAQLDQPQLVVRRDDSSLDVSESERWAGPLPDELREALSAALTRRLSTRDIAGLGRSGAEPVLRIKVQVRRLDAWLDQRIQLDADWSVDRVGTRAGTEAGEDGRLTCGGHFEVRADPGFPGLVRAQQQALADLAARIAADARTRDRGPGGRCAAAVDPG